VSLQQFCLSELQDQISEVMEPPYSRDSSLDFFSGLQHDSLDELPTVFVDDEERIWPSNLAVKQCLNFELNVDRLNLIHRHLWWAGRPVPARPLHRQRMLGREIICTQRADFHLLWSGRTMYIKPLPLYLLRHEFWTEHIGDDKNLHQQAMGFILSYVWLIRHATDFVVAQECHILPSNISWPRWRSFISSLALDADLNKISSINQRYTYGELRIRRLNQIYRFVAARSLRDVIQGYGSRYHSYSSFFTQNFAWIMILFGFGSTLLSALQVGAGVNILQQSSRFQELSYTITMAALTFPVTIVLASLALFISIFLFHLVQTLTYHKKRTSFWSKLSCNGSENIS
jgi:hypothetical protein